MTEHEEQVVVIEYCRWNKILVFAIPNGMWVPGLKGARLYAYINKMKSEGMSKGVPDLFFPIAKGGFNGLFIELKTKTGGLSTEQKEWLALLSKNGYRAICCKGSQAAIEEIKKYMEL